MPLQKNRLTPAGGLDISQTGYDTAPAAGSLARAIKLPEPEPDRIDLAVFLDAGNIDLWAYFLVPDLDNGSGAEWVLAAQFDALDPAAGPGFRQVDVPAGATHLYLQEEGNAGATDRLVAAYAVEPKQRTL